MEKKLEEKTKNKNSNKIKIALIIIIVLLLITAIGIIFYQRLKSARNNYNRSLYDGCDVCDKPIIYLYPKEEAKVSVNLEYSNKITCSYPKYVDGWNVLAKPNGDLVDLKSNRNLYALYYESKNKKEYNVTDEGFVVKREDTVKFLEEKLAILGLNDREAEEFIIYWLPKLQENEYNYIRFASMDEINENMPLEFSQQPDTLIRILMTYKGLNAPIQVKEQNLEKIERKGFIAVEWGGSEIK